MNTKEAIELLEKSWIGIGDKIIINISESDANSIISLLQQGERYKKAWEELKKNTTSNGLLNMNGEDFKSMREYIEDKYFPEETKDEY